MREETKKVIQEEFKRLESDLKVAYELSGKKVTGNWEKGLETITEGSKTILKGYTYLEGSPSGTRVDIQDLKEWVRLKGIFRIENEATVSSIAHNIQRNIMESGTDPLYEIDIYSIVITPQRMQEIIDRVAQVEKRIYVKEITIEFNKLWQ